MDQTENRGYPYPECDPPLTKDASDIAQLRDLAMAVDSDVTDVYNRAADILVRPDAGRMSMSATLAGTENTFFPFFNIRTFDTTASGTAMTDTVNGVIRLAEPGWYVVGCSVQLTSAMVLQARAAFLQNGVRNGSFCTQSAAVSGNQHYVAHTAEVFTALGGDALSLEVRLGAASPTYTYVARIWAQQVIRG